MATKTSKGWVRKQLTGDGREDPEKWAEREQGLKKQTKTKQKRVKKSDKEFMEMVKDL